MSYDVRYRVDVPDGDLIAALAVAQRIARGSDVKFCSGTLVTARANRAHALTTLHPGARLVTDPQLVDEGFTEYAVELTDVDDAVTSALLAAAAEDDGFSVRWMCGRFWHDAWIGTVTLHYHCSDWGYDWSLEPGRLEVGVVAVLDHWPETKARAVFAELAGVALDRFQRL